MRLQPTKTSLVLAKQGKAWLLFALLLKMVTLPSAALAAVRRIEHRAHAVIVVIPKKRT